MSAMAIFRQLTALKKGMAPIHVREYCVRRAVCYSSAMAYLPKRRDVLLLTSLLALQMVAVACLPYTRSSFKGPATVTNTGVFFLPPLSLSLFSQVATPSEGRSNIPVSRSANR